MPEQEEALVLRTERSGESFLKLHLLTVESGVFLCLKRVGKKPTQSPWPDLFDSARLILESSQQGTMRFVKEYQLVQRREAIGRSYPSLQCASRLAQLLVSNAAHMPESALLFDLTERALDAFAERRAPETVLLKSTYLLLKEEGYPVRESWWPQLPRALREQAREILGAPVPAKQSREARSACQQIGQNLHRWMRHHSDWIVPD